MQKTRNNWQDNARILGAITAKDVVEALKNKNTAFLIVFGLLMVIFYAQYPALVEGGEPPYVLVYDQGNSNLAANLENSPALRIYTYPSAEQMQEKLTHGEVPELGLVIPVDFDQVIAEGGTPQLQGYVMHWVTAEAAADLRAGVEAEISRLAGAPVEIQIESNRVYATPESHGLGVTAGIGFVYIIVTLGLLLVPHLILEEKQAHTLEMLLVSPASEGQVVLAKALTGLLYCLVGAGLGLVVFHLLVVHWWIAILALVSGALFAVATGLLLGTMISSREQLTILAWVFILPLFLPVVFSLLGSLLPEVVVRAVGVIPTVMMFNLLRASFSGTVATGRVLAQLAWILACTAGVLRMIVWVVRRRDRAADRLPGARLPVIRFSPVFQERLGRAAAVFYRNVNQTPAQRLPAAPAWNAARQTAWEGNLQNLRIVLAIAGKDIGLAIKNKLVLSILVGSLFMVANGSILPLLLGLRNVPAAVVYDEGRSDYVRAITARNDLRLWLVDSQEEMEAAVSGAQETRLGLVIPADFDQRAGGAEIIELKGYAAHWADPDKAAQWLAVFEQELSQVSQTTIEIRLEGPGLYPTMDTGGQLSIAALLMMVLLLTIGMALVPLLLIEEKESQTFDILLVSPASLGQILAGKALAGGFYCLVAALVVLLLNAYLIVHWWVALLVVLLGGAFAVALGLMVGLVSDTPTTTGIWGSILLLFFVALTGIRTFLAGDWPPLAQIILDWMPGTAMIDLYRMAMVGDIPAGQLWANAAALILAAGLVYAGILGRLRMAERK